MGRAGRYPSPVGTPGTWRRRFVRTASAIILAAVVAFLILFATAASTYPGGTWFNRATVGYRFWENFLCDLEWRTALNGLPNPGASTMQGAMFALAAGALPLWLVVPTLFSGKRLLGRLVRGLGVLSVVSMFATAFITSELSPFFHELAVICAGVPAALAAALATVGLARSGRRTRTHAVLGGAMLAFGLADLALYALQIAVPGTASVAIPAIQKVALFFALAWMISVAARASRLAPLEDRP